MYEAHWRLQRKPFECGADPSLYYPSEPHQAALLKLRYAIESRSGGAVVCGESGSGKTLLVRLLSERLADEFHPFVHLVYPAMPAVELLAYLAAELSPASNNDHRLTIDASVRRIQNTLGQNAAQGRHAIIAIDESHLLEGSSTFEALRLLLNFEVHGRPALTLLLAGQTALLPMLDRMPHFEERLTVKCLLRAFTVEETMSYIQHRLTAAGAKGMIFSSTALEAVHRATQGQPRRINRLCDLALLVGFAEEQTSISEYLVEALARDLVDIAPEA